MRALLLTAAAFALSGSSEDRATVTRVDPLTVQDDDFARHRDPAEWRGLTVRRAEFTEERGHWRFWRIDNKAHPKGPLWFVPHDNENAGFEAALVSLRTYGGTLIAVDSGAAPGEDGVRLNHAVDYGKPVDPNRNFDSALPGYAAHMLASGNAPIIALHTNAPGFDPTDSHCNQGDPKGDGIISIRFCDDVLTPSPSQAHAWPFDDDDSVAFATYRAGKSPSDAFCRDAMVGADFNVVQERVLISDGSLSNYAILHGLRYLNFETQDRGLEPAALAGARDRLVWMIDHALALCAPGVKPIG
ncbi:hypothetical protein AB2M62_08780 [Sphingomonas sp. MMS12-HWE2-04]|uniref:hypothetical protein n=1 Tax=Sphingomonas sp. MMS12-HWE2-04 TaxID=3234199 RepID=UPI00384A67A9